MFINAQPRIVSNSYRAFVPRRITELAYQKLAHMSPDGMNSWDIKKSVAPSMQVAEKDGFGCGGIFDEENYPVRYS